MKTLFLALLLCVISGCAQLGSPPDKKVVTPAEKPPEPAKTVHDMVSSVLKDTVGTSKIYLDESQYSSKYITLPGDKLNSSGAGLAYQLIWGIGEKQVSIGGGPFTLDKKRYPYKIVLSTEDPKVSWSTNKGGNLDLEISQAVGGATTKMSADSIHEVVIRKVGTLEIDDLQYDSAAFDAHVTALYTFKNNDISVAGFEKFAQAYGVATSGAIYEISVTEYKQENIDATVNVTGLVKSGGKIYSKVGGVVRINVIRLFYSEATANLEQLQKAHKEISVAASTRSELVKGLKNLDSDATSAKLKNAVETIKESIVE